jgi:hypothetical protein
MQKLNNTQAARYNAVNTSATHTQLNVSIHNSTNADYIALFERINKKLNELWDELDEEGVEVFVQHYVMNKDAAIW